LEIIEEQVVDFELSPETVVMIDNSPEPGVDIETKLEESEERFGQISIVQFEIEVEEPLEEEILVEVPLVI
jgi:hypothetical protein